MQKKLFLMVLIPLLVFFMTSGCMESMVKPTAKTDTGEEMALPPYSGPKAKVAVARFEWKVGGSSSTTKISGIGGQSYTVTHERNSGYMTGLKDMLTTAMVQSKRYRVGAHEC
jgi:curli biogenesis system outer membrane secretion channel CsgG